MSIADSPSPAVASTCAIASTPEQQEFLSDVMQGLSADRKSIPSKYFYDQRGSQLFDAICELPEYYPTRTEATIMRRDIDPMVRHIGQGVRLVEYGSGSSVKTRILLRHLIEPHDYVPVDISEEHLHATADDLRSEFQSLAIHPVVADFTQPFDLPPDRGATRRCYYFPGSTIGNFDADDAEALLSKMADEAEQGDGLLIGFDLQKDVAVLEAAYDDAQGVTAAFNINLLHRMNQELGADFDIDAFEHRSFYNRRYHRIEMHLVSRGKQKVSIGGKTFCFDDGESIRTEYSHKYTREGFTALAARSGWKSKAFWTDDRSYFAVMYLTRV
ncbi:L-histidine N(alpha)-methyltransferase [Crateriforma spongiae]|uniref:L-histidine N(alpha)-methyltransferase n=1 Tax=Crateriforma spongiae TaxID=2724528 RepID=UPI001445A77D|nr:L-histidine N(alpha)-methyltransferase [Crateriforma spongiae]